MLRTVPKVWAQDQAYITSAIRQGLDKLDPAGLDRLDPAGLDRLDPAGQDKPLRDVLRKVSYKVAVIASRGEFLRERTL